MITLLLVFTLANGQGLATTWLYFANMDLCQAAKAAVQKNSTVTTPLAECLVNQLGKEK